MDCKSCAKLLDDYVMDNLSGDIKTLVSSHLSQCAACTGLMRRASQLSGSIADVMAGTTSMLKLQPEAEGRVVDAMHGGEGDLLSHYDMMILFDKLSFREKWAKVRYGLKQPKESGEYKWAALQVRRLVSPAAAILVPSLAMLLLVALAGMAPQRQTVVNVRIVEDQTIPELEEPIDIPEPEIQPPDPEHIVEPMDNFIPSTSKTAVGPDVDFSPQPAQFDSVAIIRSPVTMRGIFGSRSPGARGSMLGRFGGGGHTEGAVLRALRWLKLHQEEDGSWHGRTGGFDGPRNVEAAATALGLLCFLAHGETPASPEFGKTVEGAIRWLVQNQGANGMWGARLRPGYQHAMVTFALAEAYGMTKIPSIRPAVERGLDLIISGQNPQGGWRYTVQPSDGSDSSVMGWHTQAMKAAQMAGIERPGMEAAMKRAIEGWRHLHRGDSEMGGFGYTSRGRGPLTGVGVLALQLLGKAQSDMVRGSINYLQTQRNTFDWEAACARQLYRWYYDTQARFHEGGEVWREWNKQFSVPLVNAQVVIPNAIADLNGKMVDVGYWCKAYGRGGRVADTAFGALQLMVYYRYLPTFQSPEQILAAEGGGEAAAEQPRIVEAQDLDIEIQL